MRILFLGTGTSYGVPEIGCKCPVCISDDPKNKRLRPSVFIEFKNKNILIDTTPDFRAQMLNNNIIRIDNVLFTHYHADHIMGLDDIRRFNTIQNKRLPVYGDRKTIERIKKIFFYAFEEGNPFDTYFPKLDSFIIDGPFEFEGVIIEPVEVYHGGMPVLGFRIGDFAYLTDCNKIPENSLKKLNNLKALVFGTLRFDKHISHFSIPEAIEAANKIKPRKTYFTHISHSIDHSIAEKMLPENTFIAYDGLEIII
ncbi:MBL fold metallo-hydrolase [candidate division KSB1 bacterium]